MNHTTQSNRVFKEIDPNNLEDEDLMKLATLRVERQDEASLGLLRTSKKEQIDAMALQIIDDLGKELFVLLDDDTGKSLWFLIWEIQGDTNLQIWSIFVLASERRKGIWTEMLQYTKNLGYTNAWFAVDPEHEILHGLAQKSWYAKRSQLFRGRAYRVLNPELESQT